MNKIRAILLVFLILCGFYLSAQENRPKVGLVLSGGGAKGLAHIGVLKVLEEQGIRPDYITGTSMGSIIGGLYAIGFSPSELDSLVTSLDWTMLLSDGIPLSAVSPEEKKDYNRFLVEFMVNKNGLSIPSGFVKGQQISLLLSRLAWHVADVDSFSNYPIPFKCVSADLISGTQKIFSSGDFATALRASMSIPSAFEPVRLDSMILVDGGILNNYPVKLCRDMGADIIIGVNVGSKDRTSDDGFKTLISVLTTSASIGSNLLMPEAREQTDLLISPDLEAFNTGSFSDDRKIIDIGEQAAREKVNELKTLIDSTGIELQYNQQSAIKRKEKIYVTRIDVNGLENISRSFFFANLGIQAPDTITTRMMEKGLWRLMGTRYFENVTYRLSPSPEGGYTLNMKAEESARVKAKFSLHYDNQYKAGLLANLTFRNVIAKGTRASFTADLSESPELNLSLIRFLGQKQVTAGKAEFTYENNDLPIYLGDGTKQGTFKNYLLDWRAGFMSIIGTQWKADAYLNYKRSTLQNQSGFTQAFYSGIERYGNSFLSANFDLEYNSLNARYFPEKGARFRLNYLLNLDISPIYKGSAEGRTTVSPFIDNPYEKYFSTSADFEKFFRINSKFTSALRFSGAFASRRAPLLGLSYIGGLPFNNRSREISFIGFSFREKLAEDFLLGEVQLRYNPFNRIHLTGIFNTLFSKIQINETTTPINLNKDQDVLGYGLLLSYQSILGPLQMGMGSNNSDNRIRWFLNFGFSF